MRPPLFNVGDKIYWASWTGLSVAAVVLAVGRTGSYHIEVTARKNEVYAYGDRILAEERRMSKR